MLRALSLLTRSNEPFDPDRVGTSSLNPKNLVQGPQTVHDLPTGVGRSLRPGGCPKKVIIVAQRGYATPRYFLHLFTFSCNI
jgi:hypothetical protein